LRYPAAGTANADVSLWILGLDGTRVGIDWDRQEFEYVTAVLWDAFGLLVVVQSRAQDRMRILTVDSDTGRVEVVHEDVDRAWVTIVPGVPVRTGDGALVWTGDVATSGTCWWTAKSLPRKDSRCVRYSTSMMTPYCSSARTIPSRYICGRGRAARERDG